MIKMVTKVKISNKTPEQIYNFMLNLDNETYQRWYPGEHLVWKTIKRTKGEIGSLVFFDENVGKYRLKFKAILKEAVRNKKLSYQMRYVVTLPAYLTLYLEPSDSGTLLIHEMTAGFKGLGKIMDPVLRLYLSSDFKKELENHAKSEFKNLEEVLNENGNRQSQ